MNEELQQELQEMYEADQALRHQVSNDVGNEELVAQMVEADKRHTMRLRQVVDECGWPGASLVGKNGAHTAWLLVQHADHDPAFQQQCLDLMIAMGDQEVAASSIAYLTDRVRVNTGQPQVYGTQFWTNPDGVFGPRPLEDEAGVDRRRDQVGLEPLDVYRQSMNKMNEDTERTRQKQT